jgi:hypothetical protein
MYESLSERQMTFWTSFIINSQDDIGVACIVSCVLGSVNISVAAEIEIVAVLSDSNNPTWSNM